MAEEPKVRAKRYREHNKGNHGLCVAGRCEALGGTVVTVPDVMTVAADPVPPSQAAAPAADERQAGRIEAMARAFVETLPYQVGDPRQMLGELAVELARRVDREGAAPAAIRELRVMLMQLAEAPNGPSGVVDEMRLRHHQQQLDALLAIA